MTKKTTELKIIEIITLNRITALNFLMQVYYDNNRGIHREKVGFVITDK